MAKEEPRNKKADLIDRVLGIELEWFLNVNPGTISECQRSPAAFKLMRGCNFETWSENTLALYLEHLRDAQSQGKNLMREKYAKMEKLLPCENSSSILTENLAIQEGWQQEARDKYPRILKRGDGAGFNWYLRCELDTYSPAVLESYLNDLKEASREERNLVIETYQRIAIKLGHNSLDEWYHELEEKEPPSTINQLAITLFKTPQPQTRESTQV
jgi:hypothetical protein